MINSSPVDPAMINFVRSIKEMEALVSIARNEDFSSLSQAFADQPLPDEWRNVFHMARVAPVLLSCLRECVGVIEASADDESGEGYDAESVECLLDSCLRAMTVANAGPRPSDQFLH